MTELPAVATAARDRWRSADRSLRDTIYATEFLPAFVGVFRELPLRGAPEGFARPRALVSLVGMSWQPVVLMASWVRPQRLLLLVTAESRNLQPGGDSLLSYLSRHADVKLSAIDVTEVPDSGEVEIYRHVRDFVARLPFEPRAVAVDPTGGKKSMSVAAGLAAAQLGCPIVYVDYAQYDQHIRMPLAGSEFPRLLADPLAELGEHEFRLVKAAFNRGDYGEAAAIAELLAKRLYEPREAEALGQLALGYGKWSQFDFGASWNVLNRARTSLQRHTRAGGWPWAEAFLRCLDRQLPILQRAQVASAVPPQAFEKGAVLIANHLGAAKRALDRAQATLALHLTYASLERFVDLTLSSDFRLDDNCQDDLVERLGAAFELARFHALGSRMHGPAYDKRLPRVPLMFATGAVLLATLRPDLIGEDDLPHLKALSDARNRTEFEHGLVARTPDMQRCRGWFNRALEIVRRRAELSDFDPADYSFPEFH
jgi:hypothetical protein